MFECFCVKNGRSHGCARMFLCKNVRTHGCARMFLCKKRADTRVRPYRMCSHLRKMRLTGGGTPPLHHKSIYQNKTERTEKVLSVIFILNYKSVFKRDERKQIYLSQRMERACERERGQRAQALRRISVSP